MKMVKKIQMSQKDLHLNSGQQSSNISKKSKIRYLVVRSENYERQIVELLKSLSTYARRTAKLRDAGDTVAEILNSISNSEVLNPSLKKSVFEISKAFRTIQDHRDSEILYLEDKLLPLISKYGETLHKQKEELRSNTNKIYDGRGSLGWIRSSSSSNNNNQQQFSRKRSQSAERIDRTKGREEKNLQKSIQRHELRKNLIFKKLLLKFILQELRFTIQSFNNLTFVYKHVLEDMNPTKDLKFFNEFLNFHPIKESTLNEIEEDNLNSDNDDDSGNDDEQTDDEDDEDIDDDSIKSEASSSRKQSSQDEDDIITGTKTGTGTKPKTKSTLKRFNSTPEISLTMANNTEKKSNRKFIKKFQTNKSSAKSIAKQDTKETITVNDSDLEDIDSDTENSEEDEDDDDEVSKNGPASLSITKKLPRRPLSSNIITRSKQRNEK